MSRDWLPFLDDLIEAANKVDGFVRKREFDAYRSGVVRDIACNYVPPAATAALALRARMDSPTSSDASDWDADRP